MEYIVLILSAVVGIFAAGFFVGKKHGMRIQQAIDALRNTPKNVG